MARRGLERESGDPVREETGGAGHVVEEPGGTAQEEHDAADPDQDLGGPRESSSCPSASDREAHPGTDRPGGVDGHLDDPGNDLHACVRGAVRRRVRAGHEGWQVAGAREGAAEVPVDVEREEQHHPSQRRVRDARGAPGGFGRGCGGGPGVLGWSVVEIVMGPRSAADSRRSSLCGGDCIPRSRVVAAGPACDAGRGEGLGGIGVGRRRARVPRGRALPAAGRRGGPDRRLDGGRGPEHARPGAADPAGDRLRGRGGVGRPAAAGAAGGGVDGAGAARARTTQRCPTYVRRAPGPPDDAVPPGWRCSSGSGSWSRRRSCTWCRSGSACSPSRSPATAPDLAGDREATHTGAGWHASWLVGPGLLALAVCLGVVAAAARAARRAGAARFSAPRSSNGSASPPTGNGHWPAPTRWPATCTTGSGTP